MIFGSCCLLCFIFLVSVFGQAATIEKAVPHTPYEYPFVVAINPRQRRYTRYVGVFDAEGLGAWLNHVLMGLESHFKLRDVPGLLQSQ